MIRLLAAAAVLASLAACEGVSTGRVSPCAGSAKLEGRYVLALMPMQPGTECQFEAVDVGL